MKPKSDQVIVITGASEGVGAAIARQYAASGSNLVLIARGVEKLTALADELELETTVLAVPMDVTDYVAAEEMLAAVKQQFGRIDVLINNAGFHERGAFAERDPAAISRMVEVNLTAPMVLARLSLSLLQESDSPCVINIGSLAGRAPVPGSTSYCATKFGLRGFTFALYEEWRDRGIHVGFIAPGPIDTGFIMDDIDGVSDLTFSQPISTAEQVADAAIAMTGDRSREVSLPRSSGWLTTAAYLFPGLIRRLRPMLEAKGRKTKDRLRKARGR